MIPFASKFLKKYKIYLIAGGIAVVGILWIISISKAKAYGETMEANRWQEAHQEAVVALQSELKQARQEGREKVKAAEKQARQAQDASNQRIRDLLQRGDHETLELCRQYIYPDEYIDALWLRD